LWNHNADLPLGRTRNGTLVLRKDGSGLRIELTPPATTWGQDAIESIRRGDVSGMSFAFAAKRDGGDTWSAPREVTREVKRPVRATSVASGPGIGIQLARGAHKGRVVMPFNEGPYDRWRVYAAYSDDGGDSWRIG
jgi:HK97 family phage prohead protease